MCQKQVHNSFVITDIFDGHVVQMTTRKYLVRDDFQTAQVHGWTDHSNLRMMQLHLLVNAMKHIAIVSETFGDRFRSTGIFGSVH